MRLNDFEQCLHGFKDQIKDIYKKYGFSSLLTSLGEQPKNKIYSYKLKDLSQKYSQILEKYGNSTFEDIRKIVLLECVIANWNDIFSDQYPKSTQEQYKKNLNRFLEVSTQEEGWGRYIEDVYWKDLALARQQMFPVNSGVVVAFSGFGLKQGLDRDLFQTTKFIKLLFTSGGRRGYYQIHIHTPLINNFNEVGWFQSYLQIAEMLMIHNEIKGVFRSSWFFDPVVKRISPHLKYIQDLPVNNGAKLFYLGVDSSGNAFAKSKSRLKLYNEGKYIPKSYLLIWPKKELIAWANRIKQSNKRSTQ